LTDAFLLSGKIAFGMVGLATGVRLVGMTRSKEGLGIHALAAAVIFVGAIGLAMAAAGTSTAGSGSALSKPLAVGGDLLERLALIGLGVFVWKVFRSGSRWALAATVAMGAMLLAGHVWELRSQAWPHYDASIPSAAGTQLAFALPFVWSAVEAAVEWSRGRRKLVLGLTDAATVHRFAIWSLACAGFVGICALAILAPAAREAGSHALSNAAVAIRGALYYAVAVLIFVGMFVPQLLGSAPAPEANAS
jgi:hypothetical protein